MRELLQTVDYVEKQSKEAWEELRDRRKTLEPRIETSMEPVNLRYKDKSMQVGISGMRFQDECERDYNHLKGSAWVVINIPARVWSQEADLKVWLLARLERTLTIVVACLEGEIYQDEGSSDLIEI